MTDDGIMLKKIMRSMERECLSNRKPCNKPTYRKYSMMKMNYRVWIIKENLHNVEFR